MKLINETIAQALSSFILTTAIYKIVTFDFILINISGMKFSSSLLTSILIIVIIIEITTAILIYFRIKYFISIISVLYVNYFIYIESSFLDCSCFNFYFNINGYIVSSIYFGIVIISLLIYQKNTSSIKILKR